MGGVGWGGVGRSRNGFSFGCVKFISDTLRTYSHGSLHLENIKGGCCGGGALIYVGEFEKGLGLCG